jgi:Icc-related predicted phosphoesterase
VHVGTDVAEAQLHFENVAARADVLLLAGDLTQHGSVDEACLLAEALKPLDLPVVAILGNHDYHRGEQRAIRGTLEQARVSVLEGESIEIDVAGARIGIAGAKGFGGGFQGACGSDFGEDEMKTFIRHSRERAAALASALASLQTDVKIALTHYSPIKETLSGERLEIYPFLGSYFLGEVIDAAHCAVAFHGHAHAGTERAVTAAGIPVRNVARPVIKRAYKVYSLSGGEHHDVVEAAPQGLFEIQARD